MKKVILLCLLCISSTYGQIQGCTDFFAKNFDPNATINDGSCRYTFARIKPEQTLKLSDSVVETSGLIAFDDLLWTHNDDHDTTIYGLDPNGKIKRKIKLENVVNTDWEEISQDSSYIYIGDFGNNGSGNRKDLHILRIEKESFLTTTPIIDTIAFSYSNQTDFSVQKGNSTNFDCEAFIISKDSIYLFTKQWSLNQTGVYTLPKKPGIHIAMLKKTLNVNGLVTGATLTPKNEIILCGYTKSFKTFLYLLYDCKDFNFSFANQRRINFSLTYHQIEGITTFDGKIFYISNESFIKKPIVNNPQAIHTIDLNSFLRN